LASYEAVIAERPNDLAPCLRAAKLYAGRGKEPTRAAALYREIRDIAAATTRDALYIERFPSSAAAKAAREVLPPLKARVAAEQGRA
jgi:hypothetical protein